MTINHQIDEAAATDQARLWPLDFPPKTEALYQIHNVEQNHKQVAIAWLIGICLYDSFIISDYVSAYPYLMYFTVVRFLVTTPVCLIAVARIWLKSPQYEWWATLIPLIMAVGLSCLLMSTEGDFRTNYMFGDILLMMCGVVIGRPRTIYAAISIIFQFSLYVFVTFQTDFISKANRPVSILFCMSGAVISVLTSYALEKFNRRSFLLGLRIQRLNQELKAQSLTDPLTKLANRRSYEQATTRYWNDPSLQAERVSFVLMDIDRFKLFNDSYGHSAGDLCLAKVAGCVAAAMPEKGLAVRFGGEEIILFLPSTDFTEAHGLAEHIRLAILREAIPHLKDDVQTVVSASFGVATATAESCSSAELVIRADTALYAAKRGGRNQVWPPLTPAIDKPEPLAPLARRVA